ncbi:MAG: pilus assembly protein [Bacilli bacterium]|nr:pilus assembly protein [Bacilli bacterium]
MNNKGQTLVIFIILLPIFLALCAFVIDVGLMTYENVKLKNTTKSILNSVVDKNKISEDNIKKLYKKNDINIENIEIDISNENIIVKNNYYIDSMFGKILSIHEYEVSVNAKMNLINKKIVFE